MDSSSMHWKQGQAGESTTGREWRRRIQTLRLAPLLRLAPPPQLLEVNDEIRGVRKRRRSAREVAATRISSVVGTSSVGEQLRGNGKQRRRREQLGAWGPQAVGMGKAPDTPTPSMQHDDRSLQTAAAIVVPAGAATMPGRSAFCRCSYISNCMRETV